MKIFEVITIVVLMLSDYYLTVLGNVLRKKNYNKHFISETYELNPRWRSDIDKNKWLNYKHLIIVASITLCLYVAHQPTDLRFYKGIIGFLFTLYTWINGRHLANLFTFKYLNNNPGEITGSVNVSHMFSLKSSAFNIAALAFPIFILTVLTPNSFMIGASFSCIALVFYHLSWINRYRTKIRVSYPGPLPKLKTEMDDQRPT